MQDCDTWTFKYWRKDGGIAQKTIPSGYLRKSIFRSCIEDILPNILGIQENLLPREVSGTILGAVPILECDQTWTIGEIF